MTGSRHFPVVPIHEPRHRKVLNWRGLNDDGLSPRDKKLIRIWRRDSQKGNGPFWLNKVTERMGVEVLNVSDPNGREIEIAPKFLV